MSQAEPKQDGLLIRIPEHLLPENFDSQAEYFSLSFSGSELLILKRRRRDEKPGDRQIVRLWGDLARFAVPDLLQLLFDNHQTGLLSFDLPEGVHKVVYLQNGDPVFARSSRPEDRLGETLLRMGKVTVAELEEAAVDGDEERLIGKRLVESGVITPKELFDGVRQQTLDILFGLFGEHEGNFNFFEAQVEHQPGVVVLNLAMRPVLVEGLKHRLGVRDRALSWHSLFPRFTGRANNLEMNSEERKLFAGITGGLSMAELVDNFGGDELQTLRILFHLARQGLVSIEHHAERPASRTNQNRLETTVSDFNSIFMDVFSILQAKVQGVDVRARLNSFFDNMPTEIAEVFDSVRFELDGSLPIDIVLGNLQYIERDDKVALAIKAFNELLYFILFEMRNYLSREDAERLMEIVQNMELF